MIKSILLFILIICMFAMFDLGKADRLAISELKQDLAQVTIERDALLLRHGYTTKPTLMWSNSYRYCLAFATNIDLKETPND